MKFRIKNLDSGKIEKHLFLSPDGEVCSEGIFGFEVIRGRFEIQHQTPYKDKLGKQIYIGDALKTSWGPYKVSFDDKMGFVGVGTQAIVPLYYIASEAEIEIK